MRDKRIKDKVQQVLNPSFVELVNESDMHSGPATESHYRLVVVSNGFAGLSRVERQQKVYGLLKKEFSSGLHALTMRLKTPDEWNESKSKAFSSPDCLHKNKSS